MNHHHHRFELYYVRFGQAIASFSPNGLIASLLVPVFFLFVIAFCGVVVPYAEIPTFWYFMYCASPFTYLLEGFLGVLAHDVPVMCTEKEFVRIPKPLGQICEEYTSILGRPLSTFLGLARMVVEYIHISALCAWMLVFAFQDSRTDHHSASLCDRSGD